MQISRRSPELVLRQAPHPACIHTGLDTNGFSFDSTDTAGMDYALNRALSAWYSDKGFWNDLVTRVMQQDWSWDDPAFGYVSLYYKAMKK